MLKALIVGVLVLAQVACTTMRPVSQADAATLREEVEPGDRVRIHVRDGRVYEFTVVRLADDVLYGKDDHRRYKIAYSMIVSAEVQEAQVLGTVLGVFYSLQFLSALVLVATMAALGDALNGE